MKGTKVTIIHPGTQHAPKLAGQLEKDGYLHKYISILVWSDTDPLILALKRISLKLFLKISNRLVRGVPCKRLMIFPLLEVNYFLQKSFSKNISENHRHYVRNREFQSRITPSLIKNSDIIVGYDTSSWVLIELAKKSGKMFILDQSIGHPAEMVLVNKTLSQKYPDWSEHILEKDNFFFSIEKLEFETCNFIVVASTFSKNTLIKNGISADKIFLNPYGVDLEKFSFHEKKIVEKTIFIFIGTVTVRKGIPYLFECWKKAGLTNGELWVVGPVDDKLKKILETEPSIKVFGKVINSQLPEIMKQAHVFVFPSFFEGFGLVLLEAMASGLPIITTTATAGTDLINVGEEGFVIEPGNDEQLINSLRFFYSNPEQVTIMSRKSRIKANNFTWEAYGKRWNEIIQVVGTQNN